MINLKQFYDSLQNEGIQFFTGVPDTLLNDFCNYAQEILPPDRHVIAANEGNAVALAAGYHLSTGTVSLVYMQNSGIGNAANPLLSLTNKDVYSIPLVLLIGWRGDPAYPDHEHHKKQGEVTPALLNALDIPFRVLEDDWNQASDSVRWAVHTAKQSNTPAALLVKKGVLSRTKKEISGDNESPYRMSREEAMACALECLPPDAIYIASTGRTARELHALRESKGMGHSMDFLNFGAMGHSSSIATGIALGGRGRLVVCLDGDAAAIMHLGAFATAGNLDSLNLLHVVLNNGAHESVGGQPTSAFNIDLTAIAHHAGYKGIGKAVTTEPAFREAVKTLLPTEQPAFIEVRIRKGIRPDLPLLNASARDIKTGLMKSL